jgi:DNA-binding MarR family transcriptional regulator
MAVKNLFFQEMGKRTLLALAEGRGKNISEIAAEAGGTYSHIFHLIREMEKIGLVKGTKEGRIRRLTLTQKGEETATRMRDLLRILEAEGGRGPVEKREPTPLKETPTHKKLGQYQDSLRPLFQEIHAGKFRRKRVFQHFRLLGRYRSLLQKLRPRDSRGKETKKELLRGIEEAEERLRRRRGSGSKA